MVLALSLAMLALLIFLNGSALSTHDSIHIDLSINLVAADALLEGENPYGRTALLDRAVALGSPTILVYSQLFTSYIQPPSSALWLAPLTGLSWRDATHFYLALNHVFLLAAAVLTLRIVRPAIPWYWLAAVVAVVLLLYSQIYTSFVLGQVDALLTLLLVVALWGYIERKPAVSGVAIAVGASIKLFPAVLLLYFLWRREYRLVAWGAGAGALLFLGSLAIVGLDVYRTYLTDVLPALLKGSTHYSNASIGALIARSQTPDVIGGLPEVFYLDVVFPGIKARLLSLFIGLAAAGFVGLILGRRQPLKASPGRLVAEYYLVVAVALAVSSVTWEFYLVWLLPLFLALAVAPRLMVPAPSRLRWSILGAFAIVFIGLNYPGDYILFYNDFVTDPNRLPGLFAEDFVRLYHNHLDAVLFVRLASLLATAGLLALLVMRHRFNESQTTPAIRAQAPDD
jgi:hypothetical protein